MAKKKKKIVANKGSKKKASTAKSLTWPQMHTRVSATNQKFLHAVKKATNKDVIALLDHVITAFRKEGVKRVAQGFMKSNGAQA